MNITNKLFIILIIFVISIAAINTGKAALVSDEGNYYNVEFEKGTNLIVILEEPIDSSVNHVGDQISAFIPVDIYVNFLKVIPKGSRVYGEIIKIEEAYPGRNALINIRFHTLFLYNIGEQVVINAYVTGKNADGSIGGTLTERSKIKKIVHRFENMMPIVQAKTTGPRIMGQELYISTGERWVIQTKEPISIPVYKKS